MKNLFLSPERIVLRSYQRELIFRVVGLIVLVTGLLQLPALFFAFTTWRDYQALTDKKGQLVAAENAPQTRWVSHKYTREIKPNPAMGADYPRSPPVQRRARRD